MSSTLIARALGPQGRGLYALPLAYLGIVMVLSTAGIEHANVRLAALRVDLGLLWWNSTAAAALISGVVWILVALLYVGTDGALFGGVPGVWIAVVMVLVPFMLHTLYWTGLLQLAGHLRGAILASAIGVAVHGVISVALFASGALTSFRALLLLWTTNGTTWFILLLLSRRQGLTQSRPHWPTLRRALVFGVRAHVALILVFLVLRVDQVIVQRMLGFQALGLYSLSAILAESVLLMTDPFAASLLPHQVRAVEGDERRLGYATARLLLSIGIVAAIVAWFLAPFAIPLVFGHDYKDAVWPFRLLLPGIVAFTIQRPLSQVLLMEGRLSFVTVFNGLALAMNVGANLILLPRIGVIGASISSTLTYLCIAFAYVTATRRRGVAGWRDLRPGWRELARLRKGFS